LNVVGAACLQFGYIGGVVLWSRTSAGSVRPKTRIPPNPFTY
jgi:hypothetical protein